MSAPMTFVESKFMKILSKVQKKIPTVTSKTPQVLIRLARSRDRSRSSRFQGGKRHKAQITAITSRPCPTSRTRLYKKSTHERFRSLIAHRGQPLTVQLKAVLIMLIILFIARSRPSIGPKWWTGREAHSRPSTEYPERATYTVIIHANPTLIVKLLMEK